MNIELEPKSIDEITTCKIPQQTSFWGYLKKKQGYNVKAFDFQIINGKDVAESKTEDGFSDFLIILNRINDNEQMAYIPFGDYVIPENMSCGRGLETFSESLRDYLPDDCVFIRHELDSELPWAKEDSFYDSNNNWIGPPDNRIMEMRMNFDTDNWNLLKAPTDILPSDTVIVNLNSTEDKIIKRMKQKTRYNIRLSQKKGVNVRFGNIKELDLWYRLYTETAKRNNIVLHDIEYFKNVLDADKKDPDSRLFLLFAELKNKPLAAMFLLITAERSTYLYGASSSENRNNMATYALQWEAIRLSRKKRCKEYDMFGIAPSPIPSHPMYGLYRFKTGFGGKTIHKYGCWDYPLKKRQYESFRLHEMQDSGFHI